MATINRKVIRGRIHNRIRRKVSGTAERPRLAVYFSGKHVYAQVIDDDAGQTLVSAGTTEKELNGKWESSSPSVCSQRISTRQFLIVVDSSTTAK